MTTIITVIINTRAQTSLSDLFIIQAYTFNRFPPYPQGEYVPMNNLSIHYSLKYTPVGFDGTLHNGSTVYLPKGESLIIVLAPKPLVESAATILYSRSANFTLPVILPVPGVSSTRYINKTITWDPVAFATLYAIYNYSDVVDTYTSRLQSLGINSTIQYNVTWTTSNSSIGYLASSSWASYMDKNMLRSLEAYGQLPYSITIYSDNGYEFPIPQLVSARFNTTYRLDPLNIVQYLKNNTFFVILNETSLYSQVFNVTLRISTTNSSIKLYFTIIVGEEKWKYLETSDYESYDEPPISSFLSNSTETYLYMRETSIRIIGYDEYGAAILEYTRRDYYNYFLHGVSNLFALLSTVYGLSVNGYATLATSPNEDEILDDQNSELYYKAYLLVGGALPIPSNIWLKADIIPEQGLQPITVNLSSREVVYNLEFPDYLGVFGVVNESNYYYYKYNWSKKHSIVARNLQLIYRTINLSSNETNEEYYKRMVDKCVRAQVERYGGSPDTEEYYRLLCWLDVFSKSGLVLTPVKDWEWDYVRDYCKAMNLKVDLTLSNNKVLDLCGSNDPQPSLIEDLDFGTVKIPELLIGSGLCGNKIIDSNGSYEDIKKCYSIYSELESWAAKFFGIVEYDYPPLPPQVSENTTTLTQNGEIKYILLYTAPLSNNKAIWSLQLKLIEHVHANETYVEKYKSYTVVEVNRTIGVKVAKARDGFLYEAIKYVKYNEVGQPYYETNFTTHRDEWVLLGTNFYISDYIPLAHPLNETAGVGVFFYNITVYKVDKVLLDVIVDPNPVELGGNTTVKVEVTNDRELNLSYTVELYVNTSKYLVLVDNGSATIVEGNGSSLLWANQLAGPRETKVYNATYMVNKTSPEGVILTVEARIIEKYSGRELARKKANIMLGKTIVLEYSEPEVKGNRIVFSKLAVCSPNQTLLQGDISVEAKIEYDNRPIIDSMEKSFLSRIPSLMVRRGDAKSQYQAELKLKGDLRQVASLTYLYSNFTIEVNGTVDSNTYSIVKNNTTYYCRNITVFNDSEVNLSARELVVRGLYTNITITVSLETIVNNTTIVHRTSARFENLYSKAHEEYRKVLISIPLLYISGYDYEHLLTTLVIVDAFMEIYPLTLNNISLGMDESLRVARESILLSSTIASQIAVGEDNFIDIMVKETSEIVNAILAKVQEKLIVYAKKAGTKLIDKAFEKLEKITEKVKQYILSRKLPAKLERLASRIFGDVGGTDTVGKLVEAAKKKVMKLKNQFNQRMEELDKRIAKKYGVLALYLFKKARKEIIDKVTSKVKSKYEEIRKYFSLSEIKKEVQSRYENWSKETIKSIIASIGKSLEDLTRKLLRYYLYKQLSSNLILSLEKTINGRIALHLEGKDTEPTAFKVRRIIADYFEEKYRYYRGTMYVKMLADSLVKAGEIIELVLGWTPQGRTVGKVSKVSGEILGSAHKILVLALGAIILFQAPRLQRGGITANMLALNPTLIDKPSDLMKLSPLLRKDPTPNYSQVYVNVSVKLRQYKSNLTVNPYSNETMIAFLELVDTLDQAYRAEEELWAKAELLLTQGNYTDNTSMEKALELYANYTNKTIINRGLRAYIIELSMTYFVEPNNTTLQQLLQGIDQLLTLNNELGNLTSLLVEEVNANLTLGPLVIIVDTDHSYALTINETHNTTIVLRNIGGLTANNTTLIVFIPSTYSDNITLVDGNGNEVNETNITIPSLGVGEEYSYNVTVKALSKGYYPYAIQILVVDDTGLVYQEDCLDLLIVDPQVNETINSTAKTIYSYDKLLTVNIPANTIENTSYITISWADYYATYGYDTQGNIIYPTTSVYEVYFNVTLAKPIELVFNTNSSNPNQTVYWLNETSGRWVRVESLVNTTAKKVSCNISKPGLYVVAIPHKIKVDMVKEYSNKTVWLYGEPVELYVKLDVTNTTRVFELNSYLILMDTTVNKTYVYPLLPYVGVDNEATLFTRIPPGVLEVNHTYEYIYYIRSIWGDEWSSPTLNATVVLGNDTSPPRINIEVVDTYGVESTRTTSNKLYVTISAVDNQDLSPKLCYNLDYNESRCINATLNNKIRLVVELQPGYSGEHILIVNATDNQGNTATETRILSLENIPEPTSAYSIEEYNESRLILSTSDLTEYALWSKIGYIDLETMSTHAVDIKVPLTTPTLIYSYNGVSVEPKIPFTVIKHVGGETGIPVLLPTYYTFNPLILLDLDSWRNSSRAVVDLNETSVPGQQPSSDIGFLQLATPKYYTASPSLIVGFNVRGKLNTSTVYYIDLSTTNNTISLPITYDTVNNTWVISNLNSSDYKLAYSNDTLVVVLENAYSPTMWNENISKPYLWVRVRSDRDTTPWVKLRVKGRIEVQGFENAFNPINNVFLEGQETTVKINVTDEVGIDVLKLIVLLGNGTIIVVNGTLVNGTAYNGTWSFTIPGLPKGYFTVALIGVDLDSNIVARVYETKATSPTPRVESTIQKQPLIISSKTMVNTTLNTTSYLKVKVSSNQSVNATLRVTYKPRWLQLNFTNTTATTPYTITIALRVNESLVDHSRGVIVLEANTSDTLATRTVIVDIEDYNNTTPLTLTYTEPTPLNNTILQAEPLIVNITSNKPLYHVVAVVDNKSVEANISPNRLSAHIELYGLGNGTVELRFNATSIYGDNAITPLLVYVLNTTVDVELNASISAKARLVNNTIEHRVLLENTGTCQDTFTLTTNRTDTWLVPSKITLKPGEKAIVRVVHQLTIRGVIDYEITVFSEKTGKTWVFHARTITVPRTSMYEANGTGLLSITAQTSEAEIIVEANTTNPTSIIVYTVNQTPLPLTDTYNHTLNTTIDIVVLNKTSIQWPIKLVIRYQEPNTSEVIEESLKLHYWNGTNWVPIRNQTLNTQSNTIEANITLSELKGAILAVLAVKTSPATPIPEPTITPLTIATTLIMILAILATSSKLRRKKQENSYESRGD